MPKKIEEYPGQFIEIRRAAIIEKAIELADRYICSHADGSVEELNYLTAKVAEAFTTKVYNAISSEMLRSDLSKRFPNANVQGGSTET